MYNSFFSMQLIVSLTLVLPHSFLNRSENMWSNSLARAQNVCSVFVRAVARRKTTTFNKNSILIMYHCMPFVALLIPREMCVSSIRFARRFITFALSFLGFGNCMLLCALWCCWLPLLMLRLLVRAHWWCWCCVKSDSFGVLNSVSIEHCWR